MALDRDAPNTWPAALAAIGCVLVFVAGEPLVSGVPAFSAGYVLRRVALSLFVAVALATAAFVAPRDDDLPRIPYWLGLPLLGTLLAALALPDLHAGGLHLSLLAAGEIALAALPLGLVFLYAKPEQTGATWRWLATAAALLVGFGLIERLGGTRLAASFGRPAIAGTVFGALVVPAFLFGFGRGTILRFMLPGILAAGCVASGSRAALIAATFGALVAIRLGSTKSKHKLATGIAIIGLAAFVVIGVGLATRGVVDIPGGGKTLSVRLGLHRASTALIAERPLRGHGLGRYPSEALRRRDIEEARLEPGRRPTHAHMDLLHRSVEGGVGAGLCLLVFLSAALMTAFRRTKDASEPERAALAAACGVLVTLGVAALGDGIFIDPAPVLLASVAVATILSASPSRGRPSTVLRALLIAGVLPFLAGAIAAGVAAVADAAVQGYVNERTALEQREAGGLIDRAALAEELEALADTKLERALGLDARHPEANYQRAVVHAARAAFHPAETHLRAAFGADPGKTEARLDLARVFQLQDRVEDARAVLEEASHHDATRFDLWLRLGHLTLGAEPVPGDPLREQDWTPVLRAYNEGRRLAPERFENDVALARVTRRRGDLAEADRLLEAAARRFPARAGHAPASEHAALLVNAPAEVALEAFRVAEAQGAGDAVLNGFLKLALEKDRGLGPQLLHETQRFLDEGERREAKARETAAKTLDPREFAAADRAFDAAALRLAALLQTGLADGPDELIHARTDRQARRFRTALARYRAILAWTAGPNVADLQVLDASDAARWRMELLGETASAAVRVDGALARTYYARHFLLRGLIALDEDDAERAIADLQRALDHDDEEAATHFALARAHARRADFGLGARALIRAIGLDPRFKQAAQVERDTAPLLPRPDVKAALR